eukprot:TRINITY_DN659_c0_g3_i2.p1 TRINITY_DN659_c0_g3~~TRINITY_DN659_c0_g3_i2.p1  ORF type:complete len:442 (+),score=37.72 TRINITY_DN659_c0_g3_i2:74-1399(+)
MKEGICFSINRSGFEVTLCKRFWCRPENKRQCNCTLLRMFYGLGAVIVMLLSLAVLLFISLRLLECMSAEQQLSQQYDSVSGFSGLREEVSYFFNLKFVFPGFTAPFQHLAYIWIACAVSLIAHEFGHALAACSLRVEVTKFTFNLYAFFVPIASTEVNEEAYNLLGSGKRLLIISAGIFHNVVLCAVCAIAMLSLPTLLSPAYTINNGVYVMSVSPHHSLSDLLQASDIVTSINKEPVHNIDDLKTQIYQQNQNGICFGYQDTNNIYDSCSLKNPCELEYEMCFTRSNNTNTGRCLNAMTVVSDSPQRCTNDTSCGQGYACVQPLFSKEDQTAFGDPELMSIGIQNQRNGRDYTVAYVGSQKGLINGLSMSNYVPKYAFLSIYVPVVLEQTLYYIFGISAGIALVNTLPVYCFDGGLFWTEVFNIIHKRFYQNQNYLSIV